MNWKLINFLWAALFIISCRPSTRLITSNQETRVLDTISVVASQTGTFERPVYNPSYKRRNDLIHTKLDVRFDWSKSHLLGKATLELQPLFYDTDSLRLDAKGFDIREVSIVNNGTKKPLDYVYNDNKNLFIKLDRTYTSKEKYTIFIDYTAKPDDLPIGGSDAITSDKGLYFINPDKSVKDKPQQIWTQGETESSSCWFPTVDRPNERCTQELYMTVEDKYKTLSNGLLVSSTPNSDGTRTDYWKMDLPHAPYLFMMAVGEFAVVKEEWNGMLLEYYVEPAYEKYAKQIYPNTPEMLTFFSDILGVKYPWPKYSQVVVRDYVSGAMENTTGVIFGDFVQLTDRELLDRGDVNESIVAHELMHHWFGDLVTCESWANLPLNESFANYSEYLWFEHKYGRDAADYIRMNEISGYMTQAVMNDDKHPLIYYGYADKEDMFDSHSYNKGGQILHMLRSYLGDEAFFASLKKYLTDNQYQAAEVHDLRLAFERVTGEDLNWFFQQWFFTQGHPKLEISKSYNAGNKTLNLTIQQTQDYTESTVFIMPVEIEVHVEEGKAPIKRTVWLQDQEHVFSIPADKEPLWVAVDAERVLLAERKYELTPAEYIYQYNYAGDFLHRLEALRGLQYHQKGKPEHRAVYEKALNDPFWAIRAYAIDAINLEEDVSPELIETIKKLAIDDPRSSVRASAIDKLRSLEDVAYLDLFEKALSKDLSYNVMEASLYGIYIVDQSKALEHCKRLEDETNAGILSMVGEIYSETIDRSYIGFFETKWTNTKDYSRFLFFDHYTSLLLNIKDSKLIEEKIGFFKDLALSKGNSQWGRYGAASALKKFREYLFDLKDADSVAANEVVNAAIKELKEKEDDPTLMKLYKNW